MKYLVSLLVFFSFFTSAYGQDCNSRLNKECYFTPQNDRTSGNGYTYRAFYLSGLYIQTADYYNRNFILYFRLDNKWTTRQMTVTDYNWNLDENGKGYTVYKGHINLYKDLHLDGSECGPYQEFVYKQFLHIKHYDDGSKTEIKDPNFALMYHYSENICKYPVGTSSVLYSVKFE